MNGAATPAIGLLRANDLLGVWMNIYFLAVDELG
jgi:hypothetical protein